MSIKSTQRLERYEAIEKLMELKAELKRRKWEDKAATMSNDDLGNELDRLSEKLARIDAGVCFENFLVVDGD